MVSEAHPSALQRVIAIPELHNLILEFATPASYYVFKETTLFEEILSHIPPLELLRSCVLVSKQWKTLLYASHLLFFHPHPHPDETPKPTQNPREESPYVVHPDACLPNPFLQHAFPVFSNETLHTLALYSRNLTLRAFRSFPWPMDADARKWKDANWRQMQISQPPTTQIYFCSQWSGPHFFQGVVQSPIRELERCDKGYTMGQLYDYLEQTVLYEQALASKRIQPEVTLKLYRQVWEDGNCRVNFKLSFVRNATEKEGSRKEEQAFLNEV